MTDYSKMSDFEINCGVAKCLGATVTQASFSNDRVVFFEIDGMVKHQDFCNSWADAGPIIEDKLICLAADVFAEPQDGGKWVAQPAYGWDRERVRSDNPLRAAMIVFLMMKEPQNDS